MDTTDLDQMRVAEMTQAERAVIIRQLLQQHPNLVGLVPERIRAEYGLPERARLRIRSRQQSTLLSSFDRKGWNLPMTASQTCCLWWRMRGAPFGSDGTSCRFCVAQRCGISMSLWRGRAPAGIGSEVLGNSSARRVSSRVGANERSDVRYVQCGAVPVRSQNETTCVFAGSFEPSTAHSRKPLLAQGFSCLERQRPRGLWSRNGHARARSPCHPPITSSAHTCPNARSCGGCSTCTTR